MSLAAHYGTLAAREVRAGRPNNAEEYAHVAAHHALNAIGRVHAVRFTKGARKGMVLQSRLKPRGYEYEMKTKNPPPPGSCQCGLA